VEIVGDKQASDTVFILLQAVGAILDRLGYTAEMQFQF